jgi:hypothetical protein
MVMQLRRPETEEMRERRVYQQLINELAMMRRTTQQQQQIGNVDYLAQQTRPMSFMQQHQQKSGNVAYPVQQPRPTAFMPQQQPYNHEYVRHQPVQCSYAVADIGAATRTPAETEAGSVGATNEGQTLEGVSRTMQRGSLEVSTKKVLPHGRTAPADGDNIRQDPPH